MPYPKASLRGEIEGRPRPLSSTTRHFSSNSLIQRAIPQSPCLTTHLNTHPFPIDSIIYLCCLLFLSHLNINDQKEKIFLLCLQLYPQCPEHCLAHRINSINICYICFVLYGSPDRKYSRHCQYACPPHFLSPYPFQAHQLDFQLLALCISLLTGFLWPSETSCSAVPDRPEEQRISTHSEKPTTNG